jgi:2-methylcitrate dehydratase
VIVGEAKPFPGHPRTPFSDADLEAKLRENVEPVAGPAHAGKLTALLLSVEKLGEVRELTALLAVRGSVDIDGAPEE